MEKIGEPVGGWRLERRKLLARDLLNTITTLPLCLISILEDPPILAFHRSIPRFFFFFFIICRCSFVTGIERDDRRQREAKRGKNLARGRKKEKRLVLFYIWRQSMERERERKNDESPVYPTNKCRENKSRDLFHRISARSWPSMEKWQAKNERNYPSQLITTANKGVVYRRIHGERALGSREGRRGITISQSVSGYQP